MNNIIVRKKCVNKDAQVRLTHNCAFNLEKFLLLDRMNFFIFLIFLKNIGTRLLFNNFYKCFEFLTVKIRSVIMITIINSVSNPFHAQELLLLTFVI